MEVIIIRRLRCTDIMSPRPRSGCMDTMAGTAGAITATPIIGVMSATVIVTAIMRIGTIETERSRPCGAGFILDCRRGACGWKTLDFFILVEGAALYNVCEPPFGRGDEL